MKKILIGKNDELSLVAEKIISSEDTEILLNIPRFSKLGASHINFELLKREAEASGKKLAIESVDENILNLAQHVGLESYNPFFRANQKARQVSDIRRPQRDDDMQTAQTEPQIEDATEDASIVSEEQEEEFRPTKKRGFYVKKLTLVLVLIVVIVGAYSLSFYFSKAVVEIDLSTDIWSYEGVVKADKSVAAINPDQFAIPGNTFKDTKNETKSFRASGEKYVERKAEGELTIYNAYSSDVQPLVRATRFKTPDGKIYRLVEGITVPAAKIVDGKIVPESTTAKVVADKAGAEYNIGPTERFSIPGFEGGPKFDTFYASSDKPISGGIIGNQPYPTDKDIEDGKKEVSKSLEEALQPSVVSINLPQDLIYLKDANIVDTTKLTVIPEVDSGAVDRVAGMSPGGQVGGGRTLSPRRASGI